MEIDKKDLIDIFCDTITKAQRLLLVLILDMNPNFTSNGNISAKLEELTAESNEHSEQSKGAGND